MKEPQVSNLLSESDIELNSKEVIVSFFRSLTKAQTYLPHKNLYLIFGFFWGLPIPVFSFLIAYINQTINYNFVEFFTIILNQPIYWWLMLHPIIFAIVFGAIGTIASDQNKKIHTYINLLQTLADTDGLTGLFNHRYFQTRLREESTRAERLNQDLTLLMIDIDFFKRFNDNYGHPAGDALLKEIAVLFQNNTRPYDICCRYGGEEFAVILPETDFETAIQVAQRIRVQIEKYEFNVSQFSKLHVTVSIGVALWNRVENMSNWISRADSYLYQAKEQGRNCINAGQKVDV